MSSIRGFDSLDATLDGMIARAESLSRDMGPAVLDEITEQMRNAPIPERTGELADSLRNPEDPNQIWRETESGFYFGSRTRAAKYNPKAVPKIDLEKVTEVVGEVYANGD